MLKDPVCGMDVSEPPRIRTEYLGKTVGFCSDHCRKRFDQDPAAFMNCGQRDLLTPLPAVAAKGYTCPMHPEVQSKGPGSCPKCGMDLEKIK